MYICAPETRVAERATAKRSGAKAGEWWESMEGAGRAGDARIAAYSSWAYAFG